MLRDEVNLMKQHAQEHGNVYNAFVEQNVNGLTELLRRSGIIDKAIQAEQVKVTELQRATQDHLSALRNADNVINSYKIEVKDQFEMLADKMQELKRAVGGDVRTRIDFIEQHYVPDALLAMQTKLTQETEEIKQRWLPSKLEAFQRHMVEQIAGLQTANAVPLQMEQAMTIIAEERVEELKKKVVDALKNKYDPKLAALEKQLSKVSGQGNVSPLQLEQAMAIIAEDRVAELKQQVMITLKDVCEPKIETLEKELIRTMNHTVAIGKFLEDGACPCSSGRCPCKCSTGTGAAEKSQGDPWWHERTPKAKVPVIPLTPGAPEVLGRDGGGGGGRPSPPPGFTAPGASHSPVTYHTRLLDEKTAKDDRYKYNGEDNGNTWRHDVYNYIVSRCPEAEVILNWAEQRGATEITREELVKGIGLAVEMEADVLSHHVWGFLQHGLSHSALQTFRNTEKRNGLEVWRSLVLEINSRTDCRKHGLRDRVQRPAQAADNQSIKLAMGSWEASYNEYLDAGARRCPSRSGAVRSSDCSQRRCARTSSSACRSSTACRRSRSGSAFRSSSSRNGRLRTVPGAPCSGRPSR